MSIVRIVPSSTSTYPQILLVLDTGGTEYCYASRGPINVNIDGQATLFHPGLEIAEISTSVDPFANSANPSPISVSVHMAQADAEALFAQSTQLYAAVATLYLYFGGQFEDGALKLRTGFVTDPVYGDPEQPNLISFAIEVNATDQALIPALKGFMDETSFLSVGFGEADPDGIGAYYPIVIGRPGFSPDTLSDVRKGAPTVRGNIFSASASYNRIVVAGHKVLATDITLWSNDNHAGTADLVEDTDDNGNTVTYIDLSTIAGTTYTNITNNPPTWVGWSAHGLAGPSGDGIRGLGDLVVWALGQARFVNATVDWSRIYSRVDTMNAMGSIDTYLTERISPWEWLQSEVLPHFPVYVGYGAGGLYVEPYPLYPGDRDVTLKIDASLPQYKRVTPLVWSSASIANDITVRGQLNPVNGALTKTVRASGDPSVYESDPTILTTPELQRSWTLFKTRNLEIDVPVVQDTATLNRILSTQVRKYALPSATVSYQVSWRDNVYEPGSIVSLTDSEIGITERLGFLTERAYTNGNCIISINLYPF